MAPMSMVIRAGSAGPFARGKCGIREPEVPLQADKLIILSSLATGNPLVCLQHTRHIAIIDLSVYIARPIII